MFNGGIICLMITVILGILGLSLIKKGADEEDILKMLSGICCLIIACFTILHITEKEIAEIKTTKVEAALESDYIPYLDGQIINPDTININDYIITVIDDKEIIVFRHK